MKDWGITLVRLGVMWEAVETAPLSYNMTYLNQISDMVNKLGQNGIYSLIDAHQDLLSRKTCGEGVPHFYVNDLDDYCPTNLPGILFKLFGACTPMKDYNFHTDENGLPLIEECIQHSFMKYYTAPEVCSAFE
jgi:endoglycosylceramidase